MVKGVMGRPTKYTVALGKEICARIAASESLLSICEDDHIPTKTCIYQWLIDNTYPNFSADYARARKIQAESFIDMLPGLAKNAKRLTKTIERQMPDGTTLTETQTYDGVERSRLEVDTLKWIAGKLIPRIYGPQIAVQAQKDEDDKKIVVYGGEQGVEPTEPTE